MARPRNMPESEALEAALHLFWEKGYDRTSIADLSGALGVGPSSIYNAFGSKAELFRKSIQRYLSEYAGFVPEVLGRAGEMGLEPSLKKLLHAAVELYTQKNLPGGCAMLEAGGADRSADSEGGCIAKEFNQQFEKGLRSLFEDAAKDEALASSPRILAKYIFGVMRGLSQLARDGTGRKDLLEIADHAAGSCLRRI